EILSVASVEGQEFTTAVLARVLKKNEWELVQKLSEELEKRHRLVQERGVRTVGEQRLTRYRF
ncbi:MAG: hypothetical protein GWN58_06390, partial [Anaerolineae bacterium]|nr:hypothetical protein [Anaerolineae bacterium]